MSLNSFGDTFIETTSGKPRPGVGVSVLNLDGSLATLSSDRSGTPKNNPVLTDENGWYSFYVEDGNYNLAFRSGETQIGYRPDVAIRAGLDADGARTAAVENLIGSSTTRAPSQKAVADGLADKLEASELAANGGAEMVGFGGRSIADKLREMVSVKDTQFAGGAKGDGTTDDTAAIQAAVSSGALYVFFPAGTYLHGALNLATPYQRLIGPGAKLTRTSASATISVTARGVHVDQLRFGCQTSGMAGSNLTVGAPDFRALFCESRDCAGRALLILNSGGGVVVNGGVYQTTDTSITGYDIEIRDDVGGGNTLYCAIANIITNQAFGGILISGEVGSMAIDKCQFGKLRMEAGGASKVSNCRVNGATTILSPFATFVQNDFNADIAFGQGGQPNIGSIRFDSTNVLKASASLTIHGNVIESSFHLGQIYSGGSPVTITGWNNDIWHPEVAFTPQFGAQSGSPTLGNAAIQAVLSRSGRQWTVRVDAQFGSTSNFGSGNFFYFDLPQKAKITSVGATQITDAGAGFYNASARIDAGTNRVFFYPDGNPAPNPVGPATPFTWTAGDRLIFSLTGEYTA